jgi:endonuclease YncB( thermonuclease family)
MALPMLLLATVVAVTDGDTFKGRIEVWPGIDVVTAVRVAGIDTPELKGKCASEKATALAAKARLAELLSAGPVTVEQVQLDKYAGRVDAVVRVAGKLVADTLVAEGLARKYTGGTRQGWCP